nr:probable sulfate transporter 3.5 [Tanacetum cinerariifolium]
MSIIDTWRHNTLLPPSPHLSPNILPPYSPHIANTPSLISQPPNQTREQIMNELNQLHHLSNIIETKLQRVANASTQTPPSPPSPSTTIIHLATNDQVGQLKKGINPSSLKKLDFDTKYISAPIQAGLITAMIALAEGKAIGRSFALMDNEQVDGNKEMIAFGLMNIIGSFTSCYLTTCETT